jgi:prevent-host-death family protein
MTIHVKITEARSRLSELVAASLRGEEVFLDKSGIPLARIVPVDPVPIKELSPEERKLRAGRRMAAFGMFKKEFAGWDSTVPPSMTEEEIDARERRICAPPP